MTCRWGFCGAGSICADFAAAVATALHSGVDAAAVEKSGGGHALTAVAARDLDRARDFARKFGFEKAYGSYERIADDADVNVVYIGVIHSAHYELAKMMIEAGKHVVCEKPLTLQLKETEELFEMAKAKGVFFMEGIWSRCFPVYRLIKEEINKGTIGEVIGVTAEFGQAINHRERVKNKSLGGGGLMDIGIYVVQFALLAFDGREPLGGDGGGVTASATLMDSGADETGSLSLKFGDGKFAHLIYSCKVKMKNNAVIYGSAGQIEIPDIFWSPTAVVVNGKESVFPLPKSLFPLNFPNSEGFCYEVEEVRRCLEKGATESDRLPHRDSILIHRIIHQCLDQMNVHYD